MGLSIFLEVKDGVVLAEGVACPPGALGEDGRGRYKGFGVGLYQKIDG